MSVYAKCGYWRLQFLRAWLSVLLCNPESSTGTQKLQTTWSRQSVFAVDKIKWNADKLTETKKPLKWVAFRKLVAGAGFEPTTFGLWARRATKLLHPASMERILVIMITDGKRYFPIISQLLNKLAIRVKFQQSVTYLQFISVLAIHGYNTRLFVPMN